MYTKKWLALPVLLIAIYFIPFGRSGSGSRILAPVEVRSFQVDVRSVGELEAASSLTISSNLRGDQAKIIDLVADGTNVRQGEFLAQLDPAPYEEKLEALALKIQEQDAQIESLKQALHSEVQQVGKELQAAVFEIESAELELQKVRDGDGPMEEARLRTALQKARTKFEELEQYSQDIDKLQAEGFLNPAEARAAQKKLTEAQDEYVAADLQYNTYTQRISPMQLKRTESNLRKAKMLAEEAEKAASIRVARAEAAVASAEKALSALLLSQRETQRMIAGTTIRAPAPGMAVLRRHHFQGTRRPARSGDSIHVSQPLIDLPDLTKMVVHTKVREVDLHKISTGTPVTIYVDAYPDLALTGEVTTIGVLALSEGVQAQRKEKYFGVTCSVSVTDTPLRPGMTARVTIHAEPERQALTVPVHAIRREGSKTYCDVQGSRGLERRQIEIGSCNPQYGEILSGLKAGERVALLRGDV